MCRWYGSLTGGIEAAAMAGLMYYSAGCFASILTTDTRYVCLLLEGVSSDRGLTPLFQRLKAVQSGVRAHPQHGYAHSACSAPLHCDAAASVGGLSDSFHEHVEWICRRPASVVCCTLILALGSRAMHGPRPGARLCV